MTAAVATAMQTGDVTTTATEEQKQAPFAFIGETRCCAGPVWRQFEERFVCGACTHIRLAFQRQRHVYT
jgi:hypothetical protein